jgi:hypothetical protein
VDTSIHRHTPTSLGWGLGALGLALAVGFFVRSQQLTSTPFGGVVELGAALLCAMLGAAALVSLVLSRILQRA